MARELVAAGFTLVDPCNAANVYILNSCTVTHIADRKSRQFMRAARRLNPAALVIATGCYAERDREALHMAGADIVVSNADKAQIAGMVRRRMGAGDVSGLETLPRTRAFIKIQDGCRRRCAYCIVPLVRDGEKSLPADDVIAEITARVNEGFREMVLTGTEVGAYNSGGLGIVGLLERVLHETAVERLRVSSLQPFEITDELLMLWQDSRLCRHFHISLQSGSAGVLERMKRGYTPDAYRRVLEVIWEALPDVSITTDIIVGFPGESDAEFAESLDFCRRMRFARIHVFPFSPRPGTEAADMPAQVSSPVKKKRAQAMLALAKESVAAFLMQFAGSAAEVLWEQSADGVWTGYTPNYIRVYTRSERGLENLVTMANLAKPYKDGMLAEIISGELI